MVKTPLDFIVIGAQKSGTGWLNKQFGKSNQIQLPPIKELHYFDRSPEYLSPNILSETKLLNRIIKPKWFIKSLLEVTTNLDNFNWYSKWYFSNYNDEWYVSLFKDLKKCKGEITPAYSILKEVDIARMSTLLGRETKIIFMLRNPIDRAWSSYRYRFYTQNNPKRQFKPAEEFLNSDYQILRSQYSESIRLYSKYFDSIFIGFFDAILEKPRDLLESLFKYLELDLTEIDGISDLDKRVNKSKPLQMSYEIKEMLDKMYHNEIKKLSSKYGEYFLKWKDTDKCMSEKFKSSFVVRS